MKIIAPAGDKERLDAGIKAGGNEFYMGLKGFGARRNAINFTIVEFKEAIDYIHLSGGKSLLTLNTILKDNEIEALMVNLEELYKHGLDAVILQDLGLFSYLKKRFPKLEFHGSTQMTVANHKECNYLYDLGFKRVVLSRELSMEEILEIRKKTKIELEVFVSGALCISYSGNCYISSFIGGRSGNRGMCAQVCRKKYDTPSIREKGNYILSPKDQMLDSHGIKRLVEGGIDAIKIEGRMKSPEYVYQMVSQYRDILETGKSEMRPDKLFNRGYTNGYTDKKNLKNIINKKYPSHLGIELGRINGRKLRLKEPLALGDGIAYIDKDWNVIQGEYVNRIRINGVLQKEGKPGESIQISPPNGTRYIYKNFDKKTTDSTKVMIKQGMGKIPLTGKFYGKVGEPMKISLSASNKFTVEVVGEAITDLAKKPITDEFIFEKFSELGNYPIELKGLEIDYDGEGFIPAKIIKSLKRDICDKFVENYPNSFRRKLDSIALPQKDEIEKNLGNEKIVVTVANQTQYDCVKKLGFPVYFRNFEVAREGELDKISLDTPLVSTLYQLVDGKSSEKKLDYNLNIGNSYGIEFYSKIEGVDTVYISPEFSLNYLKTLDLTSVGYMIYGHLTGMYIESSELKDGKITNENKDTFLVKNYGDQKVKILLEKPLNLIPKLDEIEEMGFKELRLDFTVETTKEIEKVLKMLEKNNRKELRKEDVVPYNAFRGVL